MSVVRGKPLVCRGAATERAKNQLLGRLVEDSRYAHCPFGTKISRTRLFYETSLRGTEPRSAPNIVDTEDVIKSRFKSQVRWNACKGLFDTEHYRLLLSYP